MLEWRAEPTSITCYLSAAQVFQVRIQIITEAEKQSADRCSRAVIRRLV